MRLEFLATLLLYILGGTLIAVLSRRFFKKDLRDYYVASSRFGAILTALTYATTTYSAFMMIGLVGLAYSTGAGSLGFELAYLSATLIILSTIGYKIWSLSREYRWVSPSQMLTDMYNSRLLGAVVSVIYLYAMIPYLTAQIIGLKVLFNYGGFGDVESIVLSALLTYLWIAIAGVWSVAATDLLQGALMIAGGLSYIGWLIAFSSSKGLSLDRVSGSLSSIGFLGITPFWTLNVFLAYTIPWVFFSITNPQVVMKLYLPKDSVSYRKSIQFFFVYGLTYTLIAVASGLVARGLACYGILPGNLSRDSVTPYILGLTDPWLGSLISVSIIAAAISTANSIVMAVSSSLLTTIGERRVDVARLVDGLLVAVAALIARFRPGFIVDLSVLTSVILLPLAPVTILGVYNIERGRSLGRIAAPATIIIGAMIATYYAIVLGAAKAFTQTVYGQPIPAIVLEVSLTVLAIVLALEKLLASSHKSPIRY
ncbi:sodium:solute symporter family protein [Thermogladius sp. 4427co]|uniref:sodium:solute symporter family protein n=1 Tax=Thermogladius sp. 4427co TaxID=3450718 RepID=UPI003F7A6BC3